MKDLKEIGEKPVGPRCIICHSTPASMRQPTFENRTTNQRFTVTPYKVMICDGCCYDAANAFGRYVDERADA